MAAATITEKTLLGAATGDLGRHTQVTSEGLPMVDHHTEIFLQITYATPLTQTLTFGFTKLAVLFFYKRIFAVRVFAQISWMMISVVIAWTCAFFIANLLQCWPIAINWSFTASEATDCIHTTHMYLGQAWSDVFTDGISYAYCEEDSELRLAKRSDDLVITSPLYMEPSNATKTVVAAGTAKLVVFYRIANLTSAGDQDLTYLGTPTIYWPMIESSLGVVGACLPLLRPIFTESPVGSLSSMRRLFTIWSFSTRRDGFIKGGGGPAVDSSSRNPKRKTSCNSHVGHVGDSDNSPGAKFSKIIIPIGSLDRTGQVPTNRSIVEGFDSDNVV
ncbi:hypothetical protein N7G274_007234 [Stereocaulon virgatum]|uniref:Rhodopsin domain-containing protein n=1 Tax=Stereocaulon virgatum TaxID=373712 RepID=A0ABR4A916_9LECA